MSELKKMTVIVKNCNRQASADLDALYNRVRLEDEGGKTFYLKEVVMLRYLERHGAIVENKPRTWYYKNLSKKSIVLIAIEKPDGKVEYDLDDMRLVAKSSILKGIVFGLGSIPGGIVVATATYGIGLLLIPMGIWYGYRNVFKIPTMLRRKTLVSDLAAHGVVVR
ncbi:hypothetical protein [Pseudomonas sp. BLCC-B112]|uniref:hypothetical protein n=1 Tax=Pseudomonas sp. BLCC-B112 TaxID=3025319 RepID=UPI00234D3AD6|nr:hypothetical protein [Pseudomonas sp. BLCC-B112]MDC7815651.1 hypothetical protein [Pseudomonas sp. BLCC-B112]